MATVAPPSVPPPIAFDDDGGLSRLRLRLTQVSVTLVTSVGTVWLWTLNPIVGIIALVAAKHIVVAVVVMGLGAEEAPTAKRI